jgi:glycosyltransferase involved in cell wall biosynthesis
VLNEKDKLLLQHENIQNVTIAFPKVDDWCYSIERNNIEPFSILFLGALNRFENQDAIIWFVDNMFPEIIKIYPNTKLYIVGGNPSNKIIGLQSENIEVTGFVDSLKIYFEKAHVAIVPLRYGAGVKIKTLETLAAKIPTISTTVGAEGIPSDNNLLVCDTETLFVKKINSIFEEYMKKGNT